MSKNPPEGYVFYERNSREFKIIWGDHPPSFNLRGWKLHWPDPTDPPTRVKPDFIKRVGWVELGPISFWYSCGRKAMCRELI